MSSKLTLKQKRNCKFSPMIEKKFIKIYQKDQELYEIILNKIESILVANSLNHYKNLRYKFKKLKRVHIGHFVLVFMYDKDDDSIIFVNFDHHDKIYLP